MGGPPPRLIGGRRAPLRQAPESGASRNRPLLAGSVELCRDGQSCAGGGHWTLGFSRGLGRDGLLRRIHSRRGISAAGNPRLGSASKLAQLGGEVRVRFVGTERIDRGGRGVHVRGLVEHPELAARVQAAELLLEREGPSCSFRTEPLSVYVASTRSGRSSSYSEATQLSEAFLRRAPHGVREGIAAGRGALHRAGHFRTVPGQGKDLSPGAGGLFDRVTLDVIGRTWSAHGGGPNPQFCMDDSWGRVPSTLTATLRAPVQELFMSAVADCFQNGHPRRALARRQGLGDSPSGGPVDASD